MLPRRFWVLVGWVIGLATLAGAAGVAEAMYVDLYALAGCEAPAAAPFYETCRDFRLIQGAANIGGTLVKVPAVGLAMVAAALAWSARRETSRTTDAKPATAVSAPAKKDAASPSPPAEVKPASAPKAAADAYAATAPTRAGARRAGGRRRSKAPSTPVINASNG